MSPNVPKTPARQFRVGDEWYDFEKAAEVAGAERAALLRQFIDWYTRKPGAKLPPRPAREEWDDGSA